VPTLVKIARNSPAKVATEAVRCLITLIEVSDEDFLAHDSVCVSISELAGGFHPGLDDEYREMLMKLLFNVAANVKVRAGLLSLWFNLDGIRNRDSQGPQSPNDALNDVFVLFSAQLIQNDFPIFYALLENVPVEGKIGDFAKTGLLYFIELAQEGDELEEWILSSDLATMMAAGYIRVFLHFI
jgi:Retinoic acid induced 16-like protein